MAWWRRATSHYLSQCWPRSLSPYGVTRPQQWVNYFIVARWHKKIVYTSSHRSINIGLVVKKLCEIKFISSYMISLWLSVFLTNSPSWTWSTVGNPLTNTPSESKWVFLQSKLNLCPNNSVNIRHFLSNFRHTYLQNKHFRQTCCNYNILWDNEVINSQNICRRSYMESYYWLSIEHEHFTATSQA